MCPEDTCSVMVIATLFTITRKWKQPKYPSDVNDRLVHTSRGSEKNRLYSVILKYKITGWGSLDGESKGLSQPKEVWSFYYSYQKINYQWTETLYRDSHMCVTAGLIEGLMNLFTYNIVFCAHFKEERKCDQSVDKWSK